MTGRIIGVLADGASLDGEAGELIELFLEYPTFFGRKLRHKHLWGVFGVARIFTEVADFFHALQELFACDSQ